MLRSLVAAACCALFALTVSAAPLYAQPAGQTTAPAQAETRTLADAQRLFYNAHYEEAAALAQALRASQYSSHPVFLPSSPSWSQT